MARPLRNRIVPRRRTAARPILDVLEPRLAPAGNILVATSVGSGSGTTQVLREFSPSGVQLRDLTIGTGSEQARDLVVSPDGRIHDYYGTFAPNLQTYDGTSGTWSSHTFAGWSTAGNISYGGTAYANGWVYVTDMVTGGDGNTQGLVRFNVSDFSAERVATTLSPIDVNFGLDGKLYALENHKVTVLDPATAAVIRSIDLPFTAGPFNPDYRSIAVDAAGSLYLACWGGQVLRFDSAGNYQTGLTVSGSGSPSLNLTDTDIDTDGSIIVGDRFGAVYETTTALSGMTGVFHVGGTFTVFVAFAGPAASPPPPAPSISVNDAILLEGNSGKAPATFTVSLSNVYTSPVTVDYAAVDGTATVADGDFDATAGTLTFAPGETTKTVTVQVVGDARDEHNETFSLKLTNPTNATIARGTGIGTIIDEDPAPVATNYAASSAGVLRDYTGSGVYTDQVSGATTLTVRSFNSTSGPPVPRDERAVLEFDTHLVPAQDLAGMTLQVTTTTATTGNPPINVYGFADDDGVTLGDATRPAVLLATFTPTTARLYSVPLNLVELLGLLQQGHTNLGIRLSGSPDCNVTFGGTSSANPPRLIVNAAPPKLSVGDVTVNEGDAATFTVSLSSALTTSATLSYTTTAVITGPAATANVDFIPAQGTLTFAPGETTKTVTVPTIGDAIADSGETFGLRVFNAPSPIQPSQLTATATIVDVANPTPAVRLNDVSVTEGQAGTGSANFIVSLSVASQNTVTVQYATAIGTATTAGNDYAAANGTVTFAPGETTKTVSVPVTGDTVYEGDESFRLVLSNPTNATLATSTGTATIIDDDPTPSASISDTSVVEGNTGNATATFTISLSNPSAFPITLRVATGDGTALAPGDYQSANASVTFNPGETSKTFSVTVVGDIFSEGDETFTATLSQPQGAVSIARATGTATIVDDDSSGTTILAAASWGTAEDANADGTYDTLNSGGTTMTVRRVSTPLEDRAVLEFDVSRVVSGTVSSITLDLNISAFTTSSGPVVIEGFAGDGTVSLADATRPVTPLGSYQPDSLGLRSVTLDRAAVLALVGGSRFLGLRLDPGATHVNTSLYNPLAGPTRAPILTFHADRPIAVADSYTLNEDTSLSVPAAGVLTNDFRPAGAASLSAVVDQLPAHGTVSLAADGSFTYSPAANFHGTDGFTYHVSDGANGSNVAAVTLTVNPVNDAPTAANDTYTTPEGTKLTVAAPGVLANDADVDGDPLTTALVSGPAHGTLALAADGSFVYTPAPSYRGGDNFTYLAGDGQAQSGVATVMLTVTPVNHPPSASNDSFSFLGGAPFSVAAPGILGNDADPDDDPLTVVIVTGVSHGALVPGADGSFTYTPSAGFFGTDSFTYQASDGTLKSAAATVILNVGRVNAPPTATNVSVSAVQNTPAPVVLAATDPDADSLVFTVVSGPAYGTLTGTGASLTYTPAAGYFGPDSFTFKANDGSLDSNTATVSIAVDARPVANGSQVTLAQGTAKTVPLSATDPDGNPLTYAIVTAPAHGTLSGTAPNLTYTPAAGYFGPDSFTFKANDGTVDSNTATVTLVVDAPPTATSAQFAVVQDTARAVTLVASDPDGTPLGFTIVTAPAHGTLSGTAPNLTYTPAAGYFGPDSFTFKAGDGFLESNTATVTIVVNAPPVAAGAVVKTTQDTPGAVTLSASDLNGDPLSYAITAAPAHGTLSGTAPNLTYRPAPGYFGPDSFSFKVSDGTLDSNTAVISILVDAPPTADGATVVVPMNGAQGITLAASDPEGDPLSYVVVGQPAHGSLSGSAPNVVYSPAVGYFGPDSFTFKVNDGFADSPIATISIVVNAPPVAADSQVATTGGASTAAPLSASDPEGSSLTYTVRSNPLHGTLSGIAPSLTYTPEPGFVGTDSFTFTASDGSLESNTATVTLAVGAALTTTTLASSVPAAVYGQAVIFTATVSVPRAPAGSSPPTGLVQFRVDGADFGGPVTLAGGVATTPDLSTLGAGNHAITAVFTSTDPTLAGSTATFAGGLNVGKAPLTVTADHQSKTYGAANPPLSASYAGFVNGDTPASLAMPVAFSTTATAASPAGVYPIIASGASSPNYTISFVAGTLDVTPAPLVVTADNVSKVYGQPNPPPSVSYAGFVNGDGPGALGGVLAFATTATATSHVGNYAITPGGLTSSNYTLTFAPGTLTVNRATVTITADAQSKPYGAPLPALTASYAGFVNGDTPASLDVPVGLATTATAASDVGAYPITASGAADPDYTIVQVPGTLTVTAIPLAVTADNATKVYGQVNPPFAATYQGFVLGQGPGALGGSLAFTTDATAASHVGHHAIAPGGLTSSNYAIALVPGDLSITPAPLTVVADGKTKPYGAPLPALTASYAGFVNGDTPASLDVPVGLATTATAASDVGAYPITASGAADPDYTIVQVPGTLTVTAIPLAVTADNATRVYGQANPAFTATYQGFVLGQGPGALGGSLTFSMDATAASHVGHHAITPGGLTSSNYAIAFVPGDLAITPAPLTVVADGKTKPFGAPLPPLTATYAGFVNGDTPASLDVPVSAATTASAGSAPGQYAIIASGAADADYAIGYIGGTLTINPPVAGDYNGDGRADLALFYRKPRTSAGIWFVPNVTPGNGLPFGSATKDIPVQGDFNGDGKTDIAVYRPSKGQWLIGGRPVLKFGQPNVSIPVPGQYDGRAATQLSYYQPTTGQWFIQGRARPIVLGGKPGDIPVPADYNGDGRTDAAVYRPSTGQWLIQGRAQPVKFGGKNDIPVPADYDGVGHAELALFRPATAQWFVSGSPLINGVRFGGPGSVPVPGDYDGTGKAQIAVFQPKTGLWSIGGHAQPIKYGGPHMAPAAAAYAYRALSGPLGISSTAARAAVHLDFASNAAALSTPWIPSPKAIKSKGGETHSSRR